MTAALVDPVRIAEDGSARIIRLHDARDLARVGGKADTLARLMALGFVVPDGIVVTSATLDEHLQRDGRRERIDSLLEDSHAELAATARHIGAIVTDGGLDTGIREDLFAAAEPLLCRGPVVVRSSAIGEDSAAGSFAGQLD